MHAGIAEGCRFKGNQASYMLWFSDQGIHEGTYEGSCYDASQHSMLCLNPSELPVVNGKVDTSCKVSI